ncbi:hypothetical protein HGRIS_011661 [Hohenbuehelia grisea]|uniref:DUF6729 domain-containing protein n=1 Tax=Hohenbuehelia grisea TaxID=104357 RepID=A0ABR3JXV7_9AGAR
MFLDDDDPLEDPEENLIEDGLGHDDDEDDEDQDADGSAQGQRRSRPYATCPIRLMEFFEHCVSESRQRDSHGLPSLYRNSTFWFSKPAAFALKKADVSPEQIYDCDMFLWDPLAFVPGITCPNSGCTSRLWHHSHVRSPRRVVDFDRTFWIIGYRYRCPTCSSPNQVTFRRWDPRILAALPRTLSAEFPARLRYRSGISTRVFTFMRACFPQANTAGREDEKSILLV